MIDFKYFVRFEIISDDEQMVNRCLQDFLHRLACPDLRLHIQHDEYAEVIHNKIALMQHTALPSHRYVTYVLTRQLRQQQSVEAFCSYIRGAALLATLANSICLLDCHLCNTTQQ